MEPNALLPSARHFRNRPRHVPAARGPGKAPRNRVADTTPGRTLTAAERAYRRKRRIAFLLVTLVILSIPTLLAALILVG